MARYIDADALIRQNLTFLWNDITDQPLFEYVIEQTPTADVVEVKHGRWMPVEYTYFGEKRYECSECRDDEFWKKRFVVHKENYCPNCGAKMDGAESGKQLDYIKESEE